MLEAVFAEIYAAHDIGHHAHIAAAIAEILVHRLAQLFAVIDQNGDGPVDPILAHIKPFRTGCGKRIALRLQDCFHFVFAICGHVLSPDWYLFATDC